MPFFSLRWVLQSAFVWHFLCFGGCGAPFTPQVLHILRCLNSAALRKHLCSWVSEGGDDCLVWLDRKESNKQCRANTGSGRLAVAEIEKWKQGGRGNTAPVWNWRNCARDGLEHGKLLLPSAQVTGLMQNWSALALVPDMKLACLHFLCPARRAGWRWVLFCWSWSGNVKKGKVLWHSKMNRQTLNYWRDPNRLSWHVCSWPPASGQRVGGSGPSELCFVPWTALLICTAYNSPSVWGCQRRPRLECAQILWSPTGDFRLIWAHSGWMDSCFIRMVAGYCWCSRMLQFTSFLNSCFSKTCLLYPAWLPFVWMSHACTVHQLFSALWQLSASVHHAKIPSLSHPSVTALSNVCKTDEH